MSDKITINGKVRIREIKHSEPMKKFSDMLKECDKIIMEIHEHAYEIGYNEGFKKGYKSSLEITYLKELEYQKVFNQGFEAGRKDYADSKESI